MASEDNKVVLQYPGGEYEMDIKQSTEGDSGFDISKLRNETGLVTFDPGYTSTGSTESKITFINGEEGILRHRGYDIADLAENATFNEVSYLLIKGHLPNEEELSHFNREIRHHTLLDEDFKAAFNIFPRNAHPMPVLSSAVNALSAYYLILPSEVSSNLARFDGMRYGQRVGDDGTRSAEEVMAATRGEGFGAGVFRFGGGNSFEKVHEGLER